MVGAIVWSSGVTTLGRANYVSNRQMPCTAMNTRWTHTRVRTSPLLSTVGTNQDVLRTEGPCQKPFSRGRQQVVRARADNSNSRSTGGGGGGFFFGFLVGGAICGSLAFLFAPQLSRRLLTDDARLKLPKFFRDNGDEALETTRRTLNDKIAQLNLAIDEVSMQLTAEEEAEEGSETEVSSSAEQEVNSPASIHQS
mmetsp:Transcript_21295/g.25634  ORF Transcript_21295/g.25634 Transcript_21295/m.25634 type:complete len:196 (+) Transcript_21295:115-702(+)